MPAIRNILLVDDDPNSRELLRLSLARYDCRLLESIDGEEGFAIAVKEKPDLIIMDHMMPKMTGYELFQKLRGNNALASTRFIMVTVKQFDQKFPERLKLEGCEFVAKPYDFVALVSLIDKMIGLPLKK